MEIEQYCTNLEATLQKRLKEVEQLKAQVNCLRDAALDAISFMVGGEAKAKLRDAYDATPEQCLAEVKAKAIEDSMPKIINACVKYAVEKYVDTTVEMVSVGQLKHLSEVRHHRKWSN